MDDQFPFERRNLHDNIAHKSKEIATFSNKKDALDFWSEYIKDF